MTHAHTLALVAALAASACSPAKPSRDAHPGGSAMPATQPLDAAPPTAGAPTAGAAIGAATMQADGTLVLQLRAEGPDGLEGDAQLTYPPSHPQYAMIRAHLGAIAPGESKPVPPWPDPIDAGTTDAR